MALVIVSLLLVAWATLVPRGGVIAQEGAGRFCLWCGDERVADALANIVLFIPLGAALVVSGMRPAVATCVCLLLALGIETAQYFALSAGRIASVSDAVTNGTGGAIGAALAARRRAFLFPRGRVAAGLACGWTLLCAATLAATAWGVSAPVPSFDGGLPAVRSPMTHVHLSSWYQGEIVATLINDTEFQQRGTGPMIVQAEELERTRARLVVVGRDTVAGVAMLYVHAPQQRNPYLLVSQRRNDIVLRASSRGATAGFAPLETSVPGAFSAESMRPTDTTQVIAASTPHELSLVVMRNSLRWSSVQPRTGTIGWSLIQSLVRPSSRYAGAATAAWLLLLLLPIGYWGWWAGHLRAYVTLGATIVIAAALVVAVQTFGIAFPPIWQWCTMAGGVAAGMLLGQFTLGYQREDHGLVDG